MGQQSLEEISIENYLLEWEDKLMDQANLYYLYTHFKVGKEYSEKKVEFYQMYSEVFYNPNCELAGWIWKKIKGFFENPNYNKNTGEINSMKYTPVQNINNTFNSFCEWKEIQW